MAIADTITSMQTHTSNAYTMIGYGTDLTGINKNLENLSNTIFNAFLEALRTPDTLFTNLPKKSGSGSNITLNDTANAPMRIELGASELSQAGTPTPDSPQDIHTISGSNKVVVCGKNLFSLKREDFTISSGDDWMAYINLPIGAYTITNNNTDRMFFNGERVETTRTITTTTTKVSIELNKTSINNYFNGTSYLQIEVGSTATSYEPYTSQEADVDLDTIEYCKIGNYEDKFIRTSGKNLFDISQSSLGQILNTSNGTTGSGGATVDTSDYIKVESNKTYVLKGTTDEATYYYNYYICLYNTNKTFVERQNMTSLGDKAYSFTPSQDGYIRFTYVHNITNLKLEKNSQATSYEPYGSNEWYIKKNIGKVVLDGSESWQSYTDLGTNARVYFTKDNISVRSNGKCNYFNVITTDSWSTDETGIVFTPISVSLIGLKIPKSELGTQDVAGVKSWLSNHNTTGYYIMSTPTYTQITGTLANQLENVYKNMLSQEGQTNILQINEDLSFELSVSAIEG